MNMKKIFVYILLTSALFAGDDHWKKFDDDDDRRNKYGHRHDRDDDHDWNCPSPIPEPETYGIIMVGGVVGIAMWIKRRRK
jgi:hypothetical protein